MICRVEVVDETGSDFSPAAIAELAEAVLAEERRWGAFSLALIGEGTIAELNRRYRHAEGPTDVLSFTDTAEEDWWPDLNPCDPDEADAPLCPFLGEVVICPEVVIRYAEEEGRSSSLQLGWTVIHGTLHLLGYDHEQDLGEMRAREQELLLRLSDKTQDLAFFTES